MALLMASWASHRRVDLCTKGYEGVAACVTSRPVIAQSEAHSNCTTNIFSTLLPVEVKHEDIQLAACRAQLLLLRYVPYSRTQMEGLSPGRAAVNTATCALQYVAAATHLQCQSTSSVRKL